MMTKWKELSRRAIR